MLNFANLLQLFKDKSFVRFLAVGVLNTSVGLATIYAAKYFAHFEDLEANVFGYAVGLIVSYSLNSTWTFEFKGHQLSALKRFLISFLVSYVANILVVMTCIKILDWNSYVAQALGMPAYTITNFLLCKYYAFKTQDVSRECDALTTEKKS